jgi:hypothetical protein
MSASSKFFSNTSEKVAGRFKHYMKHHPIISNSVLCINLWIAGDLSAQYSQFKYSPHSELSGASENVTLTKNDGDRSTREEAPSSKQAVRSFWDEVDLSRTAKCAGFGAIVTGPILATWYPFMERVCVNYGVAARYGLWGPPVVKVLADEFLMDPPCLSLFFGYMNVCEGGTMETFKKKMETQFIPSWMASLAVWPWVLLSTFRFVPTYAQAPVINACCIVWDGYLSYRNTLSKQKEEVVKQPEDDDSQSGGGKKDLQRSDQEEQNLGIT